MNPSNVNARMLAPLALFAAAIVAPTLLAFNLPPSSTQLNQLLALAGWGGVAAWAGLRWGWPLAATGWRDPAAWLDATLLLVAVAALASSAPGARPWGMSIAAAGSLVAAWAVARAGLGLGLRGSAASLAAFFGVWIACGLANAAIAAAQVMAPEWPDGDWVAVSGIAGRAVGNLRQPNHLSTVLLSALVAVVPAFETARLRRGVTVLLAFVIVAGLVLSGSRTGLVGVVLLGLWGVAESRAPRDVRILLAALPLAYVAAWAALTAWSAWSGLPFGATSHLKAEGDISSSRFGIWANTLALIARHPWAGVGFGEFNFAWSLTPFPGRPVAFFDHTHNLPLQFAVELGLPLGLLVTGLLVAAMVAAVRMTRDDAAGRAAAMMVVLVGLHSMLEYPLWYLHFLLPSAFAFGLAFGRGRRGRGDDAPPPGARPRVAAGLSGLALVVASYLAYEDYMRVVAIFTSNAADPPLEQRIATGQRSVLFAYHADYAAVAMAEQPSEVLAAAASATHYLLDTRLMIAWARALAETGEVDRARHLAARLREFRNPDAAEFFAPCDDPRRDGQRPFQCEAPVGRFDWRDFRR